MHQLNQFDEPNVCGMCKTNDPTKMIGVGFLPWIWPIWDGIWVPDTLRFEPYWPYWRVVNGCVSKFAKWGHSNQEETHILTGKQKIPSLFVWSSFSRNCRNPQPWTIRHVWVLHGPLFKESPSSGSVVSSCSSSVQWSKIIGCLLVGGWKPLYPTYIRQSSIKTSIFNGLFLIWKLWFVCFMSFVFMLFFCWQERFLYQWQGQRVFFGSRMRWVNHLQVLVPRISRRTLAKVSLLGCFFSTSNAIEIL